MDKTWIALLLIGLLVGGCNSSESSETKIETVQDQTDSAPKLSGMIPVNLEKSTLYWKGHKLLGYHTGRVSLKEADVTFDQGQLTAGRFVIDMTSVEVTELLDDGDEEEDEDENEEPEDDRVDLANHLMDGDFFDAQAFPTATFVINKTLEQGQDMTVIGDLTLKGVTREISFKATLVGQELSSKISVNRTDFGIKYGSGTFFDNLGDNAIKDEFDLLVTLVLEEKAS
ncbi:YceI family protein [bacterium SCSIO 12741]|nr:YceI family protein [bacterium SCSIO 12741]